MENTLNRLAITRQLAMMGVIGLCVVGLGRPALAYPPVHLVNKTAFQAAVVVTYAACKTDHRVAGARVSLLIKRGFCLITSISATIPGQGPVTPYTSSGTAYNDFKLEKSGNGFHIIRW